MANPIHPERGASGRTVYYFVAGVAALLVWKFLAPRAQTTRALFVPRVQVTPVRLVLAPTDSNQRASPTTAFEPTDWTVGPVALVYVAILALLVVSCLVLIIAYPTALPDTSRSLHIAPPGPRLQTDPEADLRRFRAEEERHLTTYYWIDKQKGTVHIPIQQAMEKLARTGVPGFPEGQQ